MKPSEVYTFFKDPIRTRLRGVKDAEVCVAWQLSSCSIYVIGLIRKICTGISIFVCIGIKNLASPAFGGVPQNSDSIQRFIHLVKDLNLVKAEAELTLRVLSCLPGSESFACQSNSEQPSEHSGQPSDDCHVYQSKLWLRCLLEQ